MHRHPAIGQWSLSTHPVILDSGTRELAEAQFDPYASRCDNAATY